MTAAPDIAWSELALVLAIQRGGSLRGAAKALRLSHATVSRRVAELQRGLGVHLFERDGRRLRLTAAGEDLAQTAARIEREVDGLARRIAGSDHRLEGVVKVALAPSMFAALAPALPAFGRAYPGITLELATSLSFATLTRREADIAVRQTDAPQETLVGRKPSTFETALYVGRGLHAQLEARVELALSAWPWVDWDEAHRHHASARWVRAHVDPARVRVRCDSSLTMYQLVKANVGAGFVPTMLAAKDPTLLRVPGPPPPPVFHRGIWILTHEDLRSMGRVRATMQWLGEQLHADGQQVWQGLDPGDGEPPAPLDAPPPT